MALALELLREELEEDEVELLEEELPVTTVTSLSESLEEDCLVDSTTLSEERLGWLPSHLP